MNKKTFYSTLTKNDLCRLVPATSSELEVFLKLKDLAFKTGECTASDVYIASLIGKKVRVVGKHIKSLEDKRYITRERVPIRGSKRKTREIMVNTSGFGAKKNPLLKDFKKLFIPEDIMKLSIHFNRKIIRAMKYHLKENFYASPDYLSLVLQISRKNAAVLLKNEKELENMPGRKSACRNDVLDEKVHIEMDEKVHVEGRKSAEEVDSNIIDSKRLIDSYNIIDSKTATILTNSPSGEASISLKNLSDKKQRRRVELAEEIEENIKSAVENFLDTDAEQEDCNKFHEAICRNSGLPVGWLMSDKDHLKICELYEGLNYTANKHLHEVVFTICLSVASIKLNIKTRNFVSVLAGGLAFIKKVEEVNY